MTMEIWDDKATMAFLRGDGFAGNATREEPRRIRKRAHRRHREAMTGACVGR